MHGNVYHFIIDHFYLSFLFPLGSEKGKNMIPESQLGTDCWASCSPVANKQFHRTPVIRQGHSVPLMEPDKNESTL